MQVLGADETPDAADLQKAAEKIRAVHASLKVKRLLRWTLANIPDYAEEPYVLMAAFMAADDFQVAAKTEWYLQGLAQFQEAANLPASGPTQTEYF